MSGCSSEKTDELFSFEVLEDGNAIITNCNSEAAEVSIPSNIGGYRVTSISEWAFKSNLKTQVIKIPSSVISIEGNPFWSCINLREIICDNNNPSYKTEDGILFTKNGKKLLSYPAARENEKYIVPQSVEIIGTNAFSHASYLSEISFPVSLVRIMDWAFQFCSGLRSLEIPDNVIEIGPYAFNSCVGLNQIKLPKSLTVIQDGVFTDAALTQIEIPDGVTEIKSQAFSGNLGLAYVYIPDSVQTIASDAFLHCWFPRLIISNNDLIRSFAEENGISCNDGDFTYQYDSNGNAIVTGYVGRNSSISIPEEIRGRKVVGIGYSAFLNLSEITDVFIPDSITDIERMAFSGCKNLSTIDMPANITEINNGSFTNCNLKSVRIPESVQVIHAGAFDDTTDLILEKSSESQ